MPRKKTYRIRELSYAHEVSWGGSPRDPDVAIVIEEAHRLYRCCRCRSSSCPHAKAVLAHVIDGESA